MFVRRNREMLRPEVRQLRQRYLLPCRTVILKKLIHSQPHHHLKMMESHAILTSHLAVLEIVATRTTTMIRLCHM